jgi:hypothetical protein
LFGLDFGFGFWLVYLALFWIGLFVYLLMGLFCFVFQSFFFQRYLLSKISFILAETQEEMKEMNATEAKIEALYEDLRSVCNTSLWILSFSLSSEIRSALSSTMNLKMLAWLPPTISP